MHSLESSLANHPLITLRVIGEWWELDLTGYDKVSCAKLIAERLLNLDWEEELAHFPPEESAGLQVLAQTERMAIASYRRHYGEVRAMGVSRLEREEPWYDPANVAEALWYKGLIFSAFDQQGETMVECYYLPTELRQLIYKEPVQQVAESGPHLEVKRIQQVVWPTFVDATDDLVTLLGYVQRYTPSSFPSAELGPYLNPQATTREQLLWQIAREMEWVREQDQSWRVTKSALAWLQKPPSAQAYALADAWRISFWNELHQLSQITCEGNWQNDPRLARETLLNVLPVDTEWYAIVDLLAQIEQKTPDFQRPNGDYDTWYIRSADDGAYLSGFESWPLVEGRLLHYLLTHPMRWLGLVELSADSYRLTELGRAWRTPQRPELSAETKTATIILPGDATLLFPRLANSYQRFQAQRIADLLPLEPDAPYRLRLTPTSLNHAQQQGITPQRVLAFLSDLASPQPLPPSLRRAIERWQLNGTEGTMEQAIILRVKEPLILQTLRQNPKTAPYIGESLGDRAAIVESADWQKLHQTVAQLGLLLEITL